MRQLRIMPAKRTTSTPKTAVECRRPEEGGGGYS
jgi:hypothetical protein